MVFEEEVVSEPASPSSQYLNSSVLSLYIIAVLEVEIPIFDDSLTMSLLKDVFLPINPRFSSIMVGEKNGGKKWRRVEVNLEDHVNVPIFPPATSPESYDEYLDDYLSEIVMDQLPQSRPLWEIHIIKYPTSNAAGNIIFKLHHALGDGFSLMGALLSCLQRADDPTLPLTFPSRQSNTKLEGDCDNIFWQLPRIFSGLINTVFDFGWSILKSSLVEDDRTPIRSGGDGMEFKPIAITTMTFSLDRIKQIKANLEVTINDVLVGIIFYGTRLYMQATSQDEVSNSHSTALVLLNTRAIGGYKSVDEMVRNNTDKTWGNQFAFLHVPIPTLSNSEQPDPLNFVLATHQLIKRKRNSAVVHLIGRLLETLQKFKGPEATAGYIHSTLRNSSMAISNLIGPVERMALGNHPIKGFYFNVAGAPQSLSVTMVSYAGTLRVSVGMEKGFMDPHKFKSCIENAFEMMFKAAV
ncbi:wax ester synthase/diacylglycerol acyltransferase 7-like [Cornus florida]|uniref:wax ester synthase/diacylglycerol acyltransferase 7-like n=1 Tax=Cornus florida TaxID=4283 RepID=UPI0028A17724|nr:wax ester synthase/diacylglycerol acyltransferase 7-like [Cornus florida]